MSVISLLLHDIGGCGFFTPTSGPGSYLAGRRAEEPSEKGESATALVTPWAAPASLLKKWVQAHVCDAKLSCSTVLRRGGSRSHKAKLPREVLGLSGPEVNTSEIRFAREKKQLRLLVGRIRPDQTFLNGCTPWELKP